MRSARIVTYDGTGNISGEENFESLTIKDWNETPFRLASANMRADFLSLPELRDYVRFNSDFPPSLLAPFSTHLQYRLALPWACLVVVFLAAPLAISFTRGGILSNVATAIGLVFLMNFLTQLFLALGEGDRIAPWAAAWIPNLIFASVGLLLLYLRSTNREARSLNPFAARRAPRLVNPLANDWPIKHRAEACAVTNRPFAEGEQFYTLLFREGNGFRREDLSEEAWASRNENIRPFSFWKTRFEPPPPAPPEPLAKGKRGGAVAPIAGREQQPNACYVLAVMLERKRVLKQVKTEEAESGPVLDLRARQERRRLHCPERAIAAR